MTVTADRADTPAGTETKPFVVISADTHVGTSTAIEYAPYVEAGFRQDYEDLCNAAGHDMLDTMKAMQLGRTRHMAEAADIATTVELDDDDPVRKTFRKLMRGFGVPPETVDEWAVNYTVDTIAGGGDSQKRLRILEEQGVVAELCIPGSVLDGATPMRGIASDGSAFSWARIQAYNRWLRDFCDDAPGRRAGAIVVNAYDLDATLAEIRWARAAGLFGGIMLPHMDASSGNPGYADPHWDPLWDLCADENVVLNLHIGSPIPDGELFGSNHLAANSLAMFEQLYHSRRAVWHLIFGAVFDKHPNLKMSVIENRQEWMPDCIDEMDVRIRRLGTRNHAYLKLSPQEYFDQNVFFGASTWNRKGVERRHEIGVDNIMWGTDYPHCEGATPYMKLGARYLMGGIPTEDARKMLGENIAGVYGFDLQQLGPIAERCGPTVEEMAVQLPASAIPNTASPIFEEF